MGKITAAFNMTLDGNADHTAGVPDEELHDHYTSLLAQGDVMLYGRKTYDLMTFWKGVLDNSTEVKSMRDFARAIDGIQKVVFSHSPQTMDWPSARQAEDDLETEVLNLKQQNKNILVGSRSLILQLLNRNLIDELQLCIQPVLAGKGLMLFDEIEQRTLLRLMKTKTFKGGAVVLYYEPLK